MARIDIAIKGLFATPVAAVEVPGAAALNAELERLILQRRDETPSVQASNAGGWHSDRDIETWGGAPIAAILDLAKGVATQMTADRHGKPMRPAWTVQAWANVNGPGDGNICHYHPGAFWSGTYYVADGGCASDPALGGEFEMLDPRGPGPAMYAPGLKFAGEDGMSVGSAEMIRPRPGLLMLFPSWLFHQVRPYRGTGLRISVAFNLGVAAAGGLTDMDSAARSFSRRQNEIIALLRETGRVAVEDLASLFDVSPQTIRRDLNEMSEARVITRVHGGAIVASSVQNLAYDARKLVAQAHKRLIGQAAARLIDDNSSLFINIGTTTEEVAHALAGRSGLLVITNNLNVAAELYRSRSIDVIITGGSVRSNDGGIVGATTVDMIRQFRVDTAVIGISAIETDGTLLDFDIREVHVSRAIIENARRVILVTDSSKFSRSAPARIGTLADIDILVTDHLPTPGIAELCRVHEVDVVETGGPQESDPAAPD